MPEKGKKQIFCMFNSAHFTRDAAGLVRLLSWYNMFLYFHEWTIYVDSMEDVHLLKNNGER